MTSARGVLRTDAWLAKASVCGVELRPWQLGTKEVWLALDSGAACQVVEATSEEIDYAVGTLPVVKADKIVEDEDK